MKTKKIVFTGGGTGGHIFPIIAITREIKKLPGSQGTELYYIGPDDQMISDLLSKEHIKIHPIVSGKIRRYFSFENIIDIFFKIPLGFLQSLFILTLVDPTIVFSKGGSGSMAVVLAARLLGIPIFLHESDTIPGMSNKVAFPWAKRVFISFPKTAYINTQKTMLTGNPILKELSGANKERVKAVLGLSSQKPVLLFLGGSQGAKPINDFVLGILNELLETYEVLHVCGPKNYIETQKQSSVILRQGLKTYYHMYKFLNEVELSNALIAADLVISRSGSGSIFEIAAFGKPSILIPLPSSASDHQSKNAYEYANTGAALVIEQKDLTGNFFLKEIEYMLSSPEKIKKMHEGALSFAKPMAAQVIAKEMLEYVNGK